MNSFIHFKIFFFIISLLLSTILSAQAGTAFSFLKYGEDQGLTANEIYCVVQDHEGFLWISSDNGIYKFNGNSFEKFGKKDGLSARIITRVYTMSDSSIVAIGEAPEQVYQIKNGRVKKLNGPRRLRILGRQTRQFNGRVFSGVYPHYEIKPDTIIDNNNCEANSKLQEFYPLSLDKFVGTNLKGEIFEVDAQKDVHCNISRWQEKYAIGFGSDPNGNCLIYNQEGIHRVKSEQDWAFLGKPNIANNFIKIIHILEDQQGRFWMAGAHKGLFLYDPITKNTRDLSPILGLQNVQITSLYEDTKGNLWISTAKSGLICVLNSDFKRFNLSENISGNYILNLTQGLNGEIWVGTNVNISLLIYDQVHSNWQVEEYPQTGYTISLNPFYENTLLYNAEYEIDLQPNSSVSLIKAYLLTAFYKQSDSNAYYGCFGKIQYSKYLKDNPMFYRKDSRSVIWSRKGQKVIDFVPFEETLMALTNNYLLEIDGSEVKVKTLPKLLESKDSLNYQLYDLHIDQNKTVWLTCSEGLFRYSENKWEHFSTLDGLSSNECLGICSDEESGIWIATNNGLNLFKNNEFISYTTANGLPSNKINCVLYDSISGLLLTGTNNGIAYVNPSDLGAKYISGPRSKILFLEAIGDTLFENPKRVTLEPHQNNLRINFSIEDFHNPTEFSFKYQLANSGIGWQNTKKDELEYIELRPGDYTFLVKAKTAGSSWGKPSKIQFTIKSPIWERWNFWLSIFSFMLILILGISYYRTKNIRKREKVKLQSERKINKLKIQALLSSMNPHFIFNSLNSIQHFLSKHKDPIAIDFVAEFGQLVRQNLDFSRRKYILVTDEVDYLNRYLRLESLRFNESLSFRVEADNWFIENRIYIPSMIVQPFVENSLWHGLTPSTGNGIIKITIDRYEESFINIVIEDNGIGIHHKQSQSQSEKKTHTSMGIDLIRNRIKLLSPKNQLSLEEIKDKNNQVTGTRVQISMDLEFLKNLDLSSGNELD
jgi:hypothetical protein